MANSLYISATEARCGKSLASLAIMDLLLKNIDRVGFFRPVIKTKIDGSQDEHINLILKHFNIDQDYNSTYGVDYDLANELLSKGKENELIELILQKYKSIEENFSFILIEGTDFSENTQAFETQLNLQIAKNLGSPVLLMSKAFQRTSEDVCAQVKLALETYNKNEVEVLGVMFNRADPEAIYDLVAKVSSEFGRQVKFLSVNPEDPVLISPTVGEINEFLDAEILFGKDKLENMVFRFSVAAAGLNNYLERITEKCLVICPGDRADIILGSIMAHRSETYPDIAGILLTAFTPHKNILKLLDGLEDTDVPILALKENTYEAATHLENLHSKFSPDRPDKIDRALKKFEEYVDTDHLFKAIGDVEVKGMTPKMFEYNLTKKAKTKKMHIVLPEAEDIRIQKAAQILIEKDIVEITLLGDEGHISSELKKNGIHLTNINIVNPKTSPLYDKYVDTYYDLRKAKGITHDFAKDTMLDISYFGSMMVHLGDADGMVSGAVNTTQHTIRPALQFIKTQKGFTSVSSVFFMCLDNKVLVYGDCAVNPNPDADLLAEIAIASADTAQSFGIEPRVAMLSYSSGDSGKGEEVEKVREATSIIKEKRPDLMVEGPIQYDAAVDKSVGQKKMPGSKVAGQASVLIFPDLNTGNNTYKAVQRETGAIAIGPILQGLNKPVNDLSRGCLVEDIINTVIITAIQAQELKAKK